jgi:putative Mg2+ transporter-C (MgtC) family protein
MDADRLLLELTLVGRMALAALFGFLVGAEREFRGKRAGERTFALVGMGSAGVTGVGVLLFPPSAEKVIAGVITGIGFLGVGVIWRSEEGQARGLTTAAATWAVAAVGVIAGAGLYIAAALATAIVLLLLVFDRVPGLGGIAKRLNRGGGAGRPPSARAG